MKNLIIALSLFTLPQLAYAMEDAIENPPFISIELQRKWIEDMRKVVAWSYGVKNREENTMVAIYATCAANIVNLQRKKITNILGHELYQEEVSIAQTIFNQIVDIDSINIKRIEEYMNALTAVLRNQYHIAYPNKAPIKTKSRQEREQWFKEYHQELFELNDTINPSIASAIIAGSLVPYKIAEVRNSQKH